MSTTQPPVQSESAKPQAPAETAKPTKTVKPVKTAKPVKAARAAKTVGGAAADASVPAVPDGSAVDDASIWDGSGADAAEQSGQSKQSGQSDQSAESDHSDHDPGLTALRVVVAEDEAVIRLDLAEMLEGAGYEVVGQAPDGRQAVELVREHRPDLVVMDVKMPVMDGISAADIVGKEHLAPVVMLTAFSDKDLVERARDAGVMAYVVKPFTIDDLRPAIDIARSRWEEMRSLESEIADLGERLETRKAVDRAKGVLMTQLKLSEPDAFRWIQKTAMDRRLGMREVAEAVIAGLPGKH